MPPPIVIASAPSSIPDGTNRAPAAAHQQVTPRPSMDGAPNADAVQQIALDLIDENPYQTRRSFDEAALRELAESIKVSGLAQPVVVRRGANGTGRYVLVLGERRCRSSKLAGKSWAASRPPN